MKTSQTAFVSLLSYWTCTAATASQLVGASINEDTRHRSLHGFANQDTAANKRVYTDRRRKTRRNLRSEEDGSMSMAAIDAGAWATTAATNASVSVTTTSASKAAIEEVPASTELKSSKSAKRARRIQQVEENVSMSMAADPDFEWTRSYELSMSTPFEANAIANEATETQANNMLRSYELSMSMPFEANAIANEATETQANNMLSNNEDFYDTSTQTAEMTDQTVTADSTNSPSTASPITASPTAKAAKDSPPMVIEEAEVDDKDSPPMAVQWAEMGAQTVTADPTASPATASPTTKAAKDSPPMTEDEIPSTSSLTQFAIDIRIDDIFNSPFYDAARGSKSSKMLNGGKSGKGEKGGKGGKGGKGRK